MKFSSLLLAIFCVASVSANAASKAVDLGKREYLSSCAACHGVQGKTPAHAAEFLKVVPRDLSSLAKRNGGVFPMARVYETIDGRLDVAAHGSRDMPMWGQRYTVEASPTYDDYPHDPEIFVRSRILGLIDYIYRLQEK